MRLLSDLNQERNLSHAYQVIILSASRKKSVFWVGHLPMLPVAATANGFFDVSARAE